MILYIFVVHHQLIISLRHWSSMLDHWQGITSALYASVFMHRLDSESSDSEESSLGAGGSSRSDSSDSSDSSSNSSNSSICSNSTSTSDSLCSLDGMGCIHSTLVIEEVIQVSVHMYKCMETGMEDNTIQWGKKILI